ncbi:MAG: molybdate ABC transporter substrate-binding protein [Granulosicoccaceae bacterium]|jgi:molybdate transport system substrate-binding protein
MVSAPGQASGTTLIAVASNFQLPAKALASEYQHRTGHEVRISSGSTGKLYAQIINGAPYAIFLAANRREPARLEQQGKVVDGSRFTYALGKLVLWSRDAGLLNHEPQQLLQEGRIKSIALANPQIAPYGEAGMQVLATFKANSPVGFRPIRAENVSQAFQYVATGATQTGFIAYSQLLTSPEPGKGSYWLVPQQLYDPIQQQAVLLKSAANNAVARDFLRFLQSAEGKALIASFGYGVVE